MKQSPAQGRGLVSGVATGEALVSTKAFTFAHGVEPATGVVTDIRSDIRGASVRGKILCYPWGKGSTTASAWFLETVWRGNSPAALVPVGVDSSAVIGSVLAAVVYGKGIPVLSNVPVKWFSGLSPHAILSVDGAKGEVRLG